MELNKVQILMLIDAVEFQMDCISEDVRQEVSEGEDLPLWAIIRDELQEELDNAKN